MLSLPFTIDACHDGCQKEFKDSMYWSKHKFKKACHHIMKDTRHDEKMKHKMITREKMKDNT